MQILAFVLLKTVSLPEGIKASLEGFQRKVDDSHDSDDADAQGHHVQVQPRLPMLIDHGPQELQRKRE